MSNSITRQAIIDEVTRRGWGVQFATSTEEFYWVEDADGRRRLARGARIGSEANGCVIARNKLMSYDFLQQNGYKIPDFQVYSTDSSAHNFLQRYRKIVVKPDDSEQSKGVKVDIKNMTQLNSAVQYAMTFSSNNRAILQEQLSGGLYRLLVVGDTFFAAAYRRAAFVTGDGVHTVRELIEQKNLHPLRGDDGSSPLKKISLTAVSEYIGENSLSQVLEKSVEKELLPIASVSLGGESEDVTDVVHPNTRRMVEGISTMLGLSICGFDIMCDDISQPFSDKTIPIVELNSLPGLKLHLYPTAGGRPRNPAALILDNAFLE